MVEEELPFLDDKCLRDAFRRYLSEEDESYVHSQLQLKKNVVIKINEPFLIMELYRLIPHIEDSCVIFYLPNKPNVRVGVIEIAGYVIDVTAKGDMFKFVVDDSTGVIDVLYKKEYYQKDVRKREKIDKEYQTHARNIESANNSDELPSDLNELKFPKIRPQLWYPSGTSLKDQAVLEMEWWEATRNGKLGKPIKSQDYICVFGHYKLDFESWVKPNEEMTGEDVSQGKPIIFAKYVISIEEKTYNEKVQTWLEEYVCRRYADSDDDDDTS